MVICGKIPISAFQISQLVTKVEDADKHVISLRQQFLQIQGELQEQLVSGEKFLTLMI